MLLMTVVLAPAALVCLMVAPQTMVRLLLPPGVVILGWHVPGPAGSTIMAVGIGLAAVLWSAGRTRRSQRDARYDAWDSLLDARGLELRSVDAESPFVGGGGEFGGGGASGSWSDAAEALLDD